MHRPIALTLFAGFLILNLAACSEMATLPESAGIGPRPTRF